MEVLAPNVSLHQGEIELASPSQSGNVSITEKVDTSSKKVAKDSNVRTVLRVRKLNDMEVESEENTTHLQLDGKCVDLDGFGDDRHFEFDTVLDQEATQGDVFAQSAGPLISQFVVDGANCSVFTFGQTGSGKTFTMVGQPGVEGILPQTFSELFTLIEQQRTDLVEFQVQASYLEVYNEQVFDLMSDSKLPLSLREGLNGVHAPNLGIFPVTSVADLQGLLVKGDSVKQVARTAMNRCSSRSHSIFTIRLTRTSSAAAPKTSSFHFIDLAGSETIGPHEHTTRVAEAQAINKSLSALSNVITELVQIANGRKCHVGYRNSKLTFFLRESLSGNFKTCIVCNINPTEEHSTETCATLKFAKRAKQMEIRSSAKPKRLRSAITGAQKRPLTELSDTSNSQPSALPGKRVKMRAEGGKENSLAQVVAPRKSKRNLDSIKPKIDTKEPVTSFSQDKPQCTVRWVRDTTEEDAEHLQINELLGLKLTAAKKCRGSLDDKARVEERVKLACLLKTRIRKLNTENTTVADSHKEAVQVVQQQIEEQVAQATELKAQTQSIAQARDVAKNSEAELRKDGHAEEEKTIKAEKRIENCKASLQDIRVQKQQQAGAMAGIDKELLDAQARQDDMQEMHDKLQDYSTSLQGFNSKLQADVDRMNTAFEEVSAELAVVQGEGAVAKSQLEQTANILDVSTAKASAVSSQKEAAQNQQQQLEQSITAVLDKLGSETARRTDLKAELEILSTACWSTGEEYEALKVEMQQLETEVAAQALVLEQVRRELEVHRARMKLVDDSALERGNSLQAMEERLAESNATAAGLEVTIAEGELCRKQLHNTILEMKGNIRVFCRLRPMNASEQSVGTPVGIPPSESTSDEEDNVNREIQLQFESKGRKQDHSFKFDRIFAPTSTQQEVFSEISQLVQSALDGYKVCVFAYGQTGSGKTHTMVGGEGANRGMIPLSVEQIFASAEKLRMRGWEFIMETSYLEIYNETIRDLLNANSGQKLEIKHNSDGTTNVTHLKKVHINSIDQIYRVIDKANGNRACSATNANAQSSRSHSVFSLHLSGTNESTAQESHGILHLIDLAGSERLAHSGATGDRLKETQAINKSLSSLGDVISALARNETHIPYRNSKLTYLLQNSLGGDAKTLMFANVSPAMESASETLCTMRFASKVNACVNATAQRS